MTPRQRRFATVFIILIGIAGAVSLALQAFNKNLLFFYSPSEVVDGKAPIDNLIRLGGMVVKGSVKRDAGSLKVQFDLTDGQKTMTVTYEGILPDLFREGQGIIAQGKLDERKVFVASEVLAKHDENYMPPEVAKIMAKPQGMSTK